jgi:hypothetical protein
MNDDAASGPARTLARIVHDLNHKPSSEDKAKLKEMMN